MKNEFLLTIAWTERRNTFTKAGLLPTTFFFRVSLVFFLLFGVRGRGGNLLKFSFWGVIFELELCEDKEELVGNFPHHPSLSYSKRFEWQFKVAAFWNKIFCLTVYDVMCRKVHSWRDDSMAHCLQFWDFRCTLKWGYLT